MNHKTRLGQQARRLTLIPAALPVVVLALWMAGAIPSTHFLNSHSFLSAALLGLVGVTAMGAALIADAPAARDADVLAAHAGRRLLESEPTPQRTRVLIVGASASARRAAQEIEGSGEHEVVGFVTDNQAAFPHDLHILGGTDDIPALVRRLGVQQVVVAEAPAWQQRLTEMGSSDTQTPVDLHVVPGLYEARVGRLRFHRVRDLPLVDLAPANPSPSYLMVKRAMDVSIAALGLLITAPVIALAALAIKVITPGPVLFRQERVGKGGRTFTIYKLRTMVVDAEKNTGPVLSAGASDARITPLGKLLRATRLDELPQLVNVLRGDMGIVGPRPERPCFVSRFETEIPGYRERHQVPPGITGLAQVHGGYAIDAEMKLRYDLLYIYNWSPWLDAKIMFQTFATVWRRTGQ
jgi:exopolysaccharide biosynthesis polyprenyl glycosylphosphotransferase